MSPFHLASCFGSSFEDEETIGSVLWQDREPLAEQAGHRLFQGRVGPAQFERRPTIGNRREFMVGRRGEAPLVPPYRLRSPNKAMPLAEQGRLIASDDPPRDPPTQYHWSLHNSECFNFWRIDRLCCPPSRDLPFAHLRQAV